MENKNIEKLSDEKLEQVTGGVKFIIDNLDWRDLYFEKYLPKLKSYLSGLTDSKAKEVIEWLINKLNVLVYHSQEQFIDDLHEIRDTYLSLYSPRGSSPCQSATLYTTIIETLKEINDDVIIKREK